MTFSSILGQTKALTLLSRALASGRLPHAYLFAVPAGVGKTTVARDLAAALLCRRPEEGRPCGRCPGCMKYQSGNHPDFVRIRPDGAAIKIDQVRDLKKSLNFAPFEGGLRVVLLEEVQTMRREAGNSLLKALEEPPPGNLLILIGSGTGAILDTIVSRCQVIPFAPLPMELAAAIIRQRRPELDTANSEALAVLADGCPGQALALEADGILALYRRIVTELTSLQEKAAIRTERALALAVDLAEAKEDLEPFLTLLRVFFKDVMAAAHGDRRVGRSCPPEVEQARERWNLTQLSAKMDTIDLAERALARNCNRGLISEVLLLDLFDCSPPLT